MQFFIEGAQHDAHAAVADDFLDVVMAKPAQHVWFVGRSEELKRNTIVHVHRWFRLRAASGRLIFEFIARTFHGRRFQETAGCVGGQQRFDTVAQSGRADTDLVEKGGAFPRITLRQGFREH